MKLSGILLLLFLSVTFPSPPAYAADPDTTFSPRIIYGTHVSSKNSSIVQVRRSTSMARYLCSGAVVSSRFVLTAWHCVDRLSRRMSVVAGGRKFRVHKVFMHPNVTVDSETGFIFNDLALLKLRGAVTVPPVGILASRAVAVGDDLEIWGYGLNEKGRFGILRKGAAHADWIDEDFIVTVFDFAESNSCSGDSGGPAMFGYRDSFGRERSGIVGITSTGTSPTCSLGDATFYVNLQTPAALDFILSKEPLASVL